jgi:glycosyltransferase involved in cell wall biosynthesis
MTNDVVVSFLFKGYSGEAYGGERSAAQMLANTTRPRPIVVLNVDDELADEFRAHGVEVRVLPVRNIFTNWRSVSTRERTARFCAWISYNLRSFQLLRSVNPRVVHCNDLEAFVLVAPATLLARKPVVMHVRCERTMRWFHQLAMLLAARTVTVSRGIADLHVRRAHPLVCGTIRRRTTILHNGIAVSEVDAHRARRDRAGARKLLGVPAEARAVLLVGSLEPRKGQLAFLRSVGPRLANLPDTYVYLVGGTKHDDGYEYRCRQLARSSRLADRIVFVGYTTSIFDWYEVADVVALASYAEGLPRTALEAGAFSRPIVANAIPGMDEAVVSGVSGMLVSVGAWEEYGNALVRLLDDAELRARMGVAARRVVEERFDIDTCAARFERILAEAGQ